MAGRLDGKVALITGGGSGIGRACAIRFALDGAPICVADLSLEGAAATAHTIEQAGGRALAVSVDTTDERSTDAMVQRCVDAFGGIDVLVAAAGILAPWPPTEQHPDVHTVLTIPAADFHKVIDVNLYGVLYSDRAVARWMVAQRRPGTIVNLASTAAKRPTLSAGGAYSVSKAGVWMLTKLLAQELAPHGIRVNAIGPGLIDTPMTVALREDEAWIRQRIAATPLGRAGRPEEVAATALFLASDESSYFTGELLHPAGGTFLG
jgi:NAD(P)-dependent dehydrogenase (short-subunit alcohol dehydrogenase family)